MRASRQTAPKTQLINETPSKLSPLRPLCGFVVLARSSRPSKLAFSRNGKEALPATARRNFARFLRVSLFCTLLQFAPKSALDHAYHFGLPIPQRKPMRRLLVNSLLPKLSFSATARRHQTKKSQRPTNRAKTIFGSPPFLREFLFLSLFHAFVADFALFQRTFLKLFSFFCGFRA